jgi:hypothetical protein
MNRLPTRERQRHQWGQATVEVALTLPVVVLLMLAVVQIGLVASDRLLVSHAAREVARAAAVDPELGVHAATGLDPARSTIELTGGRRGGDRLTVTVVYRSVTDVPLIGPLLPDLDLRSEVTIRRE